MKQPKPRRDEQAERILENLGDVRGMNYDQFQDLFEDRDPFEFL